MEVGDGVIRLTETDSYRRHHDEVAGSVHGETRAVVPPRYLKSLAGNEPILIEFGDDRVRFTEGSVTVTTRSIGGELHVECSRMPIEVSTQGLSAIVILLDYAALLVLAIKILGILPVPWVLALVVFLAEVRGA
jgi:hypothetical protein